MYLIGSKERSIKPSAARTRKSSRNHRASQRATTFCRISFGAVSLRRKGGVAEVNQEQGMKHTCLGYRSHCSKTSQLRQLTFSEPRSFAADDCAWPDLVAV